MYKILQIGITDKTSEREKSNQQYLIVMALLMSAGGLVWGLISLLNNIPYLSLVPFGYCLVTLFNLMLLYFTKEFKAVRFIQVMFSILLPFVFQWLMGGFHGSGAICIWALLPVAASLTFHNAKACIKWLLLYTVLVVISGWQDAYFDDHALVHTEELSTWFFVINIGVVSGAAFSLVFFFKSQSDINQKKLNESFKDLQVQEEEARQSLEEISIINERLEDTKNRLQLSFDLERQVRTSMEEKDMELYNTVVKLQKKEKELEQQREALEEANGSLHQQYSLIRTQNEVIELWNKKITQNINYARRIQLALMANKSKLQKIFKESFVIERPKDIVGGDFYWMTKLDDRIVIVIADCTGHGVSGALMSIVGISLLHEIVTTLGTTTPAEILTKLDEKLSSIIHRQEDEEEVQVNDGMDAVVLTIDIKNRSLEFSGAHNPLYMVRKGELQQFKGSRFPLGGFQRKKERVFENEIISIQPNDCIYAGSDGFKDQFGGPLRRTLVAKTVKNWLTDVSSHPMELQGKLLDESWKTWKGDNKQTDDVILMGIKFTHELLHQ